MRAPFIFTVLSLAILLLAACDRKPPMPEVRTVQTDSSAAPASTPANWLPPADSASMAAPVATPPPTGERNNAATGRGTGSQAMPMAGQNNDHSAPLASAKPASSP